MGCVLGESGTDGAECSRKVASGRRVAGTIIRAVKMDNLRGLLGIKIMDRVPNARRER